MMKSQIHPQPQPGQVQSRFLARHQSLSSLPFFSCCGEANLPDMEPKIPIEKVQSQKISIKQAMRKSFVFGEHSSTSINHSGVHLASRKQMPVGPRRQSLPLNGSSLSEMNKSDHTERPFTKNANKINFVYNTENGDADNSVHNYHTTNYIVERYIVQPQEMNIYVDAEETRRRQRMNREEHHPSPYNDKVYERSYNLNDSFEEEDIDRLDSPKWTNFEHKFISQPLMRAMPVRPESTPPPQTMGNFSFGQRQKAMFMNKFGVAFRQAESLRPSTNSKDSQSRSSEQDPRRQEQFLRRPDQKDKEILFLRGTFRKQNLNNLVRNVDAFDEMEESSSELSEVIDDYKSIMSRIHDNRSHYSDKFLQ